MKLNRNVTLLLIVLYPLILSFPMIRETVGFSLNKYYFTLPFLLIFLIVLTVKPKLTLKHAHFHEVLIGSTLLVLTLLSSSGRLTFPPVFFLITTLSVISFYHLTGNVSGRLLNYVTYAYLLTSIFSFLNPQNFENLGRFSGFTISASVYSTFLTAIFIIDYWIVDEPWRHKLLKFFFFGLFIFLSETRLNIIFFIALPLIFVLAKTKRLKGLALISFVVVLNFIYPIYAIIADQPNIITSYRYQDGRDASFELRYSLYNAVWTEYKSGTFLEQMIGKGSEEARALILQKFKYDHMPHQDFIRILYDFGLLGLSLLLLLVILNAFHNEITYSLTYLYFTSFFHNMAYNLMVILLILFFASFQISTYKRKKAQRFAS